MIERKLDICQQYCKRLAASWLVISTLLPGQNCSKQLWTDLRPAGVLTGALCKRHRHQGLHELPSSLQCGHRQKQGLRFKGLHCPSTSLNMTVLPRSKCESMQFEIHKMGTTVSPPCCRIPASYIPCRYSLACCYC